MKGTPAQNAIAVAATLCVIAGLGLKLWATHVSSTILGPHAIAAGAEDVVIGMDDRLHWLSPSGVLGDSVSLSELDLTGPIVGMQLLTDGSVLLGHLPDRSIQRCTIATRHCERMAPADRFAVRDQFKFHFDEHSERLYITDTSRHRLLVQDFATGSLVEVTELDALRYPNGVVVDARGRVLVADTNHHRIAVFDIERDRATMIEELPADTPVARDGRRWPIDVAVDGRGRIWALNGDGALSHADLVAYADAVPLLRAELPTDGDPIAVAAQDRLLLMVDPFAIAVYDVDLDTGEVRAFGDAAWHSMLSERRAHKQQIIGYGDQGLVLLAVGVVVAVLLLVAVFRSHDRGRHAHRSTGVQRGTGARETITWAEPSGEVARQLRVISRAALALGGMSLLLLAFFAWQTSRHGDVWRELAEFGFAFGAMILLVGAMGVASWWILRRIVAASIGTDGEQLYLREPGGRIVPVNPEEIVHTPRMIAYRRTSIALHLGAFGPAFEPEMFYRDIYPQIARGRKVSELHLLMYQLANGQPMTWAALALIPVLLAIIACLP